MLRTVLCVSSTGSIPLSHLSSLPLLVPGWDLAGNSESQRERREAGTQPSTLYVGCANWRMEAEAAGSGGLGEPGKGAAPVHASCASASIPAASSQDAQWVTGRRATFLGARQLPRAGYRHRRGTGPRLEHVQRVPLGRVLGAARVAPWPCSMEAQQRDLVPARQELREGRRVGTGLIGALGTAQAH